jgi:hypothetical protein
MANQPTGDEEKWPGRWVNAEEYPVFSMASITVRTENEKDELTPSVNVSTDVPILEEAGN